MALAHLAHLAARIYGTPLLLAPPKLDVILSVLGARIGWPEPGAALPAPVPRPAAAAAPAGIAVLGIHGTLVRRTLGLDAASGLLSYDEIGASLEAALADPQVAGIVLDLDSPGGETGGCFELARRVRAANRVKPVWAMANDAAYSAAYAIGCAAERLYVTETGGAGSIGVIALHVDQSAKDAQDGYRYSTLSAGAHKADFSPHAPLSAQASSALQAEVDRLYALFVEQVALHRGLSAEQVRATEAALYFGAQAVQAGLADALASPTQVLAEFADTLAARRRVLVPSATSATSAASTLPEAAAPVSVSPALNPNPHLNQENPPVTDEIDTLIAQQPEAAPTNGSASVPCHAAAQAQAQAQAIAELCLIAGCPQRTSEFLGSGLNADQVRRALLDARATQTEIASRISADAAVAPQEPSSPIVAAVKQLITKG
ncbi:S49 family peptidase [Serpentinimonas maccroryi]|uniref:S49 family peptidase n=1 Tax=Serpentinimonas maccroryi TaxID=1458426 RepID=UPI002034128D|nr:S49 family peptidase [Serpentinimonas maccroryi]MCM2479200.1 S49 family peptidase [Serpentinimonas maccroryi]